MLASQVVIPLPEWLRKAMRVLSLSLAWSRSPALLWPVVHLSLVARPLQVVVCLLVCSLASELPAPRVPLVHLLAY
jgi:hypothetical protein